jgi:hypothetical protein
MEAGPSNQHLTQSVSINLDTYYPVLGDNADEPSFNSAASSSSRRLDSAHALLGGQIFGRWVDARGVTLKVDRKGKEREIAAERPEGSRAGESCCISPKLFERTLYGTHAVVLLTHLYVRSEPTCSVGPFQLRTLSLPSDAPPPSAFLRSKELQIRLFQVETRLSARFRRSYHSGRVGHPKGGASGSEEGQGGGTF